MAEVKNSFISSKMNKDLDDRLIPNGEYRNAVNVSINKSTGENVGTAQTVLGNQLIIDYGNFLGASNLEVIGVLPDDNSNTIYSFLTNNILQKYVPKGSVGFNLTYPNNQNSFSSDAPIRVTLPGAGYSAAATGSTTNVTVFNSEASGLSLAINCETTAATGYNLIQAGGGYPQSSSGINLSLITVTGSGTGATINFTTNSSGEILTITPGNQAGFGYAIGDVLLIQGQVNGSLSAAQVQVTSVNTEGAVMSASVKNSGSLYTVGDIVQVDGFDAVTGSAAQVTVTSILPNDNFIVSFNVERPSEIKTIAKGSFLNFSTLNPITGISLLEQLLFFTDNRNQPRKVNITRIDPYYTTEDQISVAKYYPFDPIQLYQPSQVSGAVYGTGVIDAVSNSKTITFSTTPTQSTPTSLGVIGTFAKIVPTATGNDYSNATGLSTTGGTGFGLTVAITVDAQTAVETVAIVKPGSGYSNGDIVTIIKAGSNDSAQATISVVKDNTFITDSSDWPNSIKVNQTQTLPAGMTISIVQVETNMQNAISEYLPPQAEALLQASASTPVGVNQFPILLTSLNGDPELEGLNVHLKDANGDFEDTGSEVTTVTVVDDGSIFYFVVDVSPAINPTGLGFSSGDEVLFAISNPYYDNVFKDNANVDFLSDKFVRFSYRYKFDDGEYSLIAPFTQPTFIPEQDGYFLVNGVVAGTTAATAEFPTDEENAYRSTEVKFMENKVNKVLLNIPLPVVSNNLNNDFKITEIDVLYKESDQTTIKVVESIPVTGNVFGTSPFYQYEYGSKPPFKTLPQTETTRVSDKVPVKALAQEIASNRVIYGNYQDKHTPPKFLNYRLAAESKKPTFTIGENNIENYTSIIEYPNASLKQNRTYELGIVLADRFGRQSTVIFSKTKLSGNQSFIASSIYSQYRTLFDNEDVNSNNPNGGLLNYDGDSLKVEFVDAIQSFKSPNPINGVPGIYNGDVLSENYNPLGWYSFKVVVKQTEQDYYNVYLPTAMAAYPLDATKEIDTTTHVVLFGDNINKIPRDLSEVGPTQREFPSSVRLFGRVSNNRLTKILGGDGTNQFYPGRTASLSTSVGTIRDLFDYNAFPGINQGTTTGEYIFYNFDYISSFDSSGLFEDNTYPDSSSLIARIEGAKIGVPIPTNVYGNNAYDKLPKLNVFETAPIVSLLDIYYETTTAGKITELNTAITSGAGANIFSQVSNFDFLLKESLRGVNSNEPTQSHATGPFEPLQFDGSEFTNPAANTCVIVSIENESGSTVNEDGIPYFNNENPSQGIFGIESILDSNGIATGKFRVILTYEGSATPQEPQVPGLVVDKSDVSPFDGPFNLIFTFEFNNTESDQPFVSTFFAEIENESPTNIEVIDEGWNQDTPSSTTLVRSFGNENTDGTAPNNFLVKNDAEITENAGPFLSVKANNGSKTQSLQKLGLEFEIIQIIDYVTTLGEDRTAQGIGDQFFTIGPNEQPAGSLYSSADAIISIPEFNSLTSNRLYLIRLKISDGGSPNALAVTADYYVQFISAPLISWFINDVFCNSPFGVVATQTTTTSPTQTNNRSNFYNMTLRGGSTIWYGGAFGVQGESSISGAQCINAFGCVQTPPGFISCQNEISIPIIVDNAPIRLFLQLNAVNNCSNTEFDPDGGPGGGFGEGGDFDVGGGFGNTGPVQPFGSFQLTLIGGDNSNYPGNNDQVSKVVIPGNISIPANSSWPVNQATESGFIEINPPDNTPCGEQYTLKLFWFGPNLTNSSAEVAWGLTLFAQPVP